MTVRRIPALVGNPARIQPLIGLSADNTFTDLVTPPAPFDYVVTDLGKVSSVASGAVAAQGTLTATAQPGNLDTVTVDAKVYTFQTALLNVDGNVQIGADLATSLSNLANAVDLVGTPGTDYALATTIHPTVRADATATTVLFTAKTASAAANAFAFSETGATLSVDGGGTLGGTTLGVSDPLGGSGLYLLQAFTGVPGPADLPVFAPVAVTPQVVAVTAAAPGTALAFHFTAIVIATLLDNTLTVLLPAGIPTDGDRLIVKDGIGNAGANAITINGNGLLIQGAATLVIAANFGAAEIVFNATINQWLIKNIHV